MQLSLSKASLENFSRPPDLSEDSTANLFPLGPQSPAVPSGDPRSDFQDLLSSDSASSKSAPTSSAGTRRLTSETFRRATLADLDPVLNDPAVLGRLVSEQMVVPMPSNTSIPSAIGLPSVADNTADSENEDGIAESAASFSSSIRSSPSHRSVALAASQSTETFSPGPAVSNFSLSNSLRPLESDGSRVRTDVEGASVVRAESPGFPGDDSAAAFAEAKFSLSGIQNYGADKLRLSPASEEITIDLTTAISRAPHATIAGVTERTATLLSEATSQLAPTTTAAAAMTGSLSLSDRPANLTPARSDTAANVIAANIAESLSKYSAVAKSVSKAAAGNFLTTEEQLVEDGSDSLGTDVAKPSHIMSDAFNSHRDLSPLEPASAAFASTVVIPHETAVRDVAIPPTEASNIANRAVDAVMTAAERVVSGERTAVNLHFLLSGNELAVRVEYRGGEVRATFTTDSPELRAALSHEWAAAGSNRAGDAPRLGTPAFVSTQAGGGNDFSGEGARQQRQSAHRDAPENLDFRQSFSSRAAPSSPDPRVAPAPQRIVSSSTSHFHTFA